MGKSLGKVTVLGEYVKNPRLPKVSVDGRLTSEPDGLLFTPDTEWVKPFTIPWEDIVDTDWGQQGPEGFESVFWSFAWPLVIISLGHISPVQSYALVEFRDETYGVISRVRFKVGGYLDEPRAHDLARTILEERGQYRTDLREAVKLHHFHRE